MGTNPNLLAHWKLAGDCRDHSGNGHHGENRGVDLAADGATFDGRGAHILVATSTTFDPSAFDLATNRPLGIGAGAIDTFRGRIRDLRLYRGAVTDAEIAELGR